MASSSAGASPCAALKTEDSLSTLFVPPARAQVSGKGSSSSATLAEPLVSGEPAPEHLYQSLVGSSSVPLFFAWWPLARKWCHDELVERCTRCLPGVRPEMDLVALPRLQEVEELWAVWAEQQGMAAWQVVWFSPFPERSGSAGQEEDEEALTAPELALDEVMAGLSADGAAPSPGNLAFYPMYLTAEMLRASKRWGLRTVGDAADHPICELGSAKAWLHPHINPEKRGPSLRDALPPACGGDGVVARGPWGYVASSSHELVEAMRRLRSELPGVRLVLKPSWGSGGDGIIMDIEEEQLASFLFPAGGQHTAILEELIEGSGESPTLYMIGGEPCGLLADQLLSRDGTINDGNRWPSPTASESLTQTCIAAAREIQSVWGLRSQWGLDFVISKDGVPIIVDLNMGRPNGNFSVRLWESRFCQTLYLHSSTWVPPESVSAQVLFEALKEHDLAWDPVALQGVLVYQHFRGKTSAYAVASAASWEVVGTLLGKLSDVMKDLDRCDFARAQN